MIIATKFKTKHGWVAALVHLETGREWFVGEYEHPNWLQEAVEQRWAVEWMTVQEFGQHPATSVDALGEAEE